MNESESASRLESANDNLVTANQSNLQHRATIEASLCGSVVVTAAPTEAKTVSRLESVEIKTRPRLYVSKKNHSKTEEMSSISLYNSSLLLHKWNSNISFQQGIY